MGGVILIAGLSAIKVFHDKSIVEGRRLIEDSVLSQLFSDSELLSEALAGNLRDPLYSYDLSRIRAILRELSKNEDVTYLYLTDAEGKVVHDGTRSVSLFGESVSTLIPESVISIDEGTATLFNSVVHVNRRIMAGETSIGTLFIGMEDDNARNKVAYYGQLLAKEQKQNETVLLTALLLIFFALLVLALPLVFFTSKRLLKPLYDLVKLSDHYAEGERDISFDLKRDDEFGVLGKALDNMVETLDDTHQQVWKLAYLDTLTELPNRRYFHEKLDEVISDSVARSEKFAMFFIDLDFFKQVNDAYGHDIGDQLLQAISKRLIASLDSHLSFHAEVKSQNRLISRISGDEFVLILPIVKVSDAKEFAESLYERFGVSLELAGRRFIQSISAGITYFPYQATSAKQLMKNADIAMYQAKKMGRSTYCEFNEVLKSDFQRRSMIKQTAAAAFDENQFFIEYQPIFEIESSTVTGAEALIRWAHPNLGRLWPSSFIGVFDESGVTTKLSLWMLERILIDFKGKRLPHENFRVSINITSRVFLDPEFSTRMIQMAQEYGVPKGYLCIELTETDLTKNSERCRYYSKLWLDAGISLWIDDFGGVSSSLTFLNELPVDALKMSGPLVRDLEHGTVKPIIQAIQSLASALDVSVIASGVESQAQLRLMKELGCEFAQGFCLGPPLAVSQLPSMLDPKLMVAE